MMTPSSSEAKSSWTLQKLMSSEKNFCNESLLTECEKAKLEHLLVKYQSFFARHRTGIGISPQFKVKLAA